LSDNISQGQVRWKEGAEIHPDIQFKYQYDERGVTMDKGL
jgi:hypothetical protein